MKNKPIKAAYSKCVGEQITKNIVIYVSACKRPASPICYLVFRRVNYPFNTKHEDILWLSAELSGAGGSVRCQVTGTAGFLLRSTAVDMI